MSGVLIPGLLGRYAGLSEAQIPPPPEWLAVYLYSLMGVQVVRFRSSVEIPFRITSGYRDPAKNEAVGGAKNSAHMHGLAVDVVPDSWRAARELADAWERETGGKAIVEVDHVHLNLPRAWGWSVIRSLAVCVVLGGVLLTLIVMGVLDGKRKNSTRGRVSRS